MSTVVLEEYIKFSLRDLLYLLQSPLTKSSVPNLNITGDSKSLRIILINRIDLKSSIPLMFW